MRAISLWQPWASLWLSPAKIHETRHWATSYVGPVAVHAAKRFETNVGEDLASVLRNQFGAQWRSTLPRGSAVLGVVDLVSCRRTEIIYPTFFFEGDPGAPNDYWCGDFSPGRFAWERGAFRRFANPITVVGRQGFFQVPDALIERAA